MSKRSKIYFASDFHLGTSPKEDSLKRENKIISWLDHIKDDAEELYLLGDIFDFWFEYRTVVPKGYIRFLGKLAELADTGIKIILFKGNHDMWMFDYFKDQLNAAIIDDELILEKDGHVFYLHHGDGLGPGDKRYKVLKKMFRSKLCQWLFARLHPNLGIGIATRWSTHSRAANNVNEAFLGEENEWLITYSKGLTKDHQIDFYIYGHRHLPYDHLLDNGSRVINLGEWMNFQSYAVWDGQTLALKAWE